jgi:hypothetical protein
MMQLIMQIATSESLIQSQLYSILSDDQKNIEQALHTKIEPKVLSKEIAKAYEELYNNKHFENEIIREVSIRIIDFDKNQMNVFCKCMITQETFENEVTIRYVYLICFDKDELEYELLESRQCTIPLFTE